MDAYGYVLGVVLTDGSVFASPDKIKHARKDGSVAVYSVVHYCIRLQCKDRPFAQRFSDALAELLNRPVSVRPFERSNFRSSTLTGKQSDHVFRGFQVAVKARALAERLMAHRADMGSVTSAETLRGMLTAVVDADGYVTVGGDIVIRQKDPAWVASLCQRLGVPARVQTYDTQTAAAVQISRRYARAIPTFKVPKQQP